MSSGQDKDAKMNNFAPEVLEIFKQATSLAQVAQPIFEKQAACSGRAIEVSDALVACGAVPIEKRAEVAGELKDPLVAYDYIIKLAQKLPVESLGEPGEKRASYGGDADQKFLDWLVSG